jgi:hypothetical protein
MVRRMQPVATLAADFTPLGLQVDAVSPEQRTTSIVQWSNKLQLVHSCAIEYILAIEAGAASGVCSTPNQP